MRVVAGRKANSVARLSSQPCNASEKNPSREAAALSRRRQMRYSFRVSFFRIETMAYVVTENCIKCKFTDCVDVCPVDCFHEGPNFLVIDPDECIDCTLCVPECPAEAIFAEDDVPDTQRAFIALNAELAKAWPTIVERKDPLPEADEWNGRPDKLKDLER